MPGAVHDIPTAAPGRVEGLARGWAGVCLGLRSLATNSTSYLKPYSTSICYFLTEVTALVRTSI
jgi:hypothetical protein